MHGRGRTLGAHLDRTCAATGAWQRHLQHSTSLGHIAYALVMGRGPCYTHHPLRQMEGRRVTCSAAHLSLVCFFGLTRARPYNNYNTLPPDQLQPPTFNATASTHLLRPQGAAPDAVVGLLCSGGPRPTGRLMGGILVTGTRATCAVTLVFARLGHHSHELMCT